jgi:hypothetical protein
LALQRIQIATPFHCDLVGVSHKLNTITFAAQLAYLFIRQETVDRVGVIGQLPRRMPKDVKLRDILQRQ